MRMSAETIGEVQYNTSGFNNYYGYGRINALGSLLVARGPAEPVENCVELNQYGECSTSRHFASTRDIDSFLFATDNAGTLEIVVSDNVGSGGPDWYPTDPGLLMFDVVTAATLDIDYDDGSDDNAMITRSLTGHHLYRADVFTEVDLGGSVPQRYELTIKGPARPGH